MLRKGGVATLNPSPRHEKVSARRHSNLFSHMRFTHILQGQRCKQQQHSYHRLLIPLPRVFRASNRVRFATRLARLFWIRGAVVWPGPGDESNSRGGEYFSYAYFYGQVATFTPTGGFECYCLPTFYGCVAAREGFPTPAKYERCLVLVRLFVFKCVLSSCQSVKYSGLHPSPRT